MIIVNFIANAYKSSCKLARAEINISMVHPMDEQIAVRQSKFMSRYHASER